MKSKIPSALILIFLFTLLSSCKEQGFVKAKNEKQTIHLLDSVVQFDNPIEINSFNLTYNPKSNGYVKLILQNGDIYEAKSVEGGSFSSIHSLLKDRSVQFDTIRKEIVIQKGKDN